MEFHGFYIPKDISRKIKLYAIAKNLPVSQVLRSSIQKLFEGEESSVESLERAVITRMQQTWEYKTSQAKAENTKAPRKVEFLKEWKKNLKYLDQETTERILKEYEKNQQTN